MATEISPKDQETAPIHYVKPEKPNWGGLILLAAACLLVLYGIYVYQLKPLLSMRLPDHQPLPLDSPPVQLTSFQVREGGKDLTPQNVVCGRESVYVSFVEEPLIQVYSARLKRLGLIRLDRPAPVTPVSLAVTDSFLVVADTLKGLLAVYDHSGEYVNSVAWYPGRKVRIYPSQIATDGNLLVAVDRRAAQVAVISLVTQQPYYDFLELMNLIPGDDRTHLREPATACITPEGSFWLGDASGKGMIYSSVGDFVNELEPPKQTRITTPISFAVAGIHTKDSTRQWDPGSVRIHLLDQTTGKVYVYDLSGRLKLVYPQDHSLRQPTSIAINSQRREIFIVESSTRSIVVLGY